MTNLLAKTEMKPHVIHFSPQLYLFITSYIGIIQAEDLCQKLSVICASNGTKKNNRSNNQASHAHQTELIQF